MNRELKFRAWHKEGYFNYLDLREGSECDFTNLQLASAQFEQYTGFRDEDGKEVYEGDILRSPSGFLLKIGWNNEQARFGWMPISDIFELPGVSISHCKVIGNAHENSDLLRVEVVKDA